MTNELIAYLFDHDYIRRDGVLYESRPTWSFDGYLERRISEDEIPAAACRLDPPIKYESQG